MEKLLFFKLFYREVLNQNRQITRPQSIKESFSDFAEAIIAKMKSYMHQCSIYLNQSLKGVAVTSIEAFVKHICESFFFSLS
jgi:hypothetical protein